MKIESEYRWVHAVVHMEHGLATIDTNEPLDRSESEIVFEKGGRMKRLILMVLALALIIVPVAFAGGGQEAEAEDGPINLHTFHFKVTWLDEWNAATDRYIEQSEFDVSFNNEIRGGGAQWMTLLRSKFAADAAPDIFVVEGTGQAAQFEDFLTDLSDEPWVERALPFALEGMTIDGQVLGMPMGLESYGYIYNRDMFEAAGITELPTTFAELEDVAQRLEDAGFTAFSTGFGEWWVMGLHLMNLAFAHQPDPQGFMDRLMAGEETMAGNPMFENLQRLIDLNVRFGEANPLTTDSRRQTQDILNEDAAMIQQGVWREIQLLEAAPDMNWGMMAIPFTDDPATANRMPTGVPFYWIVNGGSSARTQEVARDFLDWLVRPDGTAQQNFSEFNFIPAYGDIEVETLGPISQDGLTAAAAERTVPWMFGQFPDGMPQAFADGVQAYIAGQQTWAETLEEFDREWARLR